MPCLHAGWGFDLGIQPCEAPSIALEYGRAAVGAPNSGRLAPRAAADFVVLDTPRSMRTP
jgi:cytosine/adenosine deaminase-related metal-dependent hydrolase